MQNPIALQADKNTLATARRAAFAVCILGMGLIATGCAQPSRQIIADPGPAGNQVAVKRISDDGQGGLILPDGSRVSVDARGGFTLPNGDYVRRDASGALNLPNGSRCERAIGGFICP